MIQQGQGFKLKAKGLDGQPLWAYRYRVKGRASMRPHVGGFASRAEAQKALRKALDRVGPGRGGRITLAELAERLDHAGDADGFARALASFIELAGGSIPVQVVGTELVVRTTAGPFRLTIAREGSEAPSARRLATREI